MNDRRILCITCKNNRKGVLVDDYIAMFDCIKADLIIFGVNECKDFERDHVPCSEKVKPEGDTNV